MLELQWLLFSFFFVVAWMSRSYATPNRRRNYRIDWVNFVYPSAMIGLAMVLLFGLKEGYLDYGLNYLIQIPTVFGFCISIWFVLASFSVFSDNIKDLLKRRADRIAYKAREDLHKKEIET